MRHPSVLPAPRIEPKALSLSNWEREYEAFGKLLPELLRSHKGQYVAVHGGQVVDAGPEKLSLALRVLAKVGNVDIHVGFVGESDEPAVRSGVRRVVRGKGAL